MGSCQYHMVVMCCRVHTGQHIGSATLHSRCARAAGSLYSLISQPEQLGLANQQLASLSMLQQDWQQAVGSLSAK